VADPHSLNAAVGVTTPTAAASTATRFRGRWLARRQRVLELLFLLPAVAFILLFFGYPIVENLIMAFENYREVWHSSVFSKAARNTLFFTVGSIAGQFTIGLGLALYFQRKFPLSGLLRSLLLLPWLIPLLASTTIWKWMLDEDNGVLNRLLADLHLVSGHVGQHPGWLTNPSLALVSAILVNIWIGIPFNATILYGGLRDIPEHLYEAAALDGATGWRAFRYITWPLLRPVVNVVLVLGVVYTLKVIDIILGLTGGGPANATQTIATESYQLSFVQFDFGQGAAAANILIVISLIFAVIYLRANRRAVSA
jgi:multiple sugar transport system permease protein